mgnify:CR=1 FL=1
MLRFLILLLVVSAASAQVTLDACIRNGLRNHPSLRLAQNEERAGAEELKQARSARLPSLDFSGSYRYQSVVPEFRLQPLSLPIGGVPIELFPGGSMALGMYDNFDFRLTVAQPLFAGFRLVQRQSSAEWSLRSKQAQVLKARNELAFKITSVYGQALKAERLLAIAHINREQVEAHRTRVRGMLAQGLVRRDDLLKTEVKLSEVELLILQAENAVRLSRALLENLTGEPLTDSLAAMVYEPTLPTDLDAAVAEAFRNRPELRELMFLERAGEAAMRIAGGGRLPTIGAFGTFGYGKPGLDFIKKEWMDYWLVGAGVEWNVWNWGKTRSQMQQAQIRRDSVSEAMRQMRQTVTLEVTEAYIRLHEAQQTLQLLNASAAQAAESYRVAENSYQQGQATHTDYFDAQSQWLRVQQQISQAEIDLAVAQANWRRALGLPLADE